MAMCECLAYSSLSADSKFVKFAVCTKSCRPTFTLRTRVNSHIWQSTTNIVLVLFLLLLFAFGIDNMQGNTKEEGA